MNFKLLAATAMITAFSAPALAADYHYFVVQDTTTKKCTVAYEKPTTNTSVVVSPTGKVYPTEHEAETAMKTITTCQTK